MSKDNAKKTAANIIDDVKQYVDLKLEYFQLVLSEKISILVGNVIFLVIMALFCLTLILLFVFLIYNLLMMWIGIEWLAIVINIAFVALLMLFLWGFRKKLIVNPVASLVINTLYDSEDNDKDDDDDEDEE